MNCIIPCPPPPPPGKEEEDSKSSAGAKSGRSRRNLPKVQDLANLSPAEQKQIMAKKKQQLKENWMRNRPPANLASDVEAEAAGQTNGIHDIGVSLDQSTKSGGNERTVNSRQRSDEISATLLDTHSIPDTSVSKKLAVSDRNEKREESKSIVITQTKLRDASPRRNSNEKFTFTVPVTYAEKLKTSAVTSGGSYSTINKSSVEHQTPTSSKPISNIPSSSGSLSQQTLSTIPAVPVTNSDILSQSRTGLGLISEPRNLDQREAGSVPHSMIQGSGYSVPVPGSQPSHTAVTAVYGSTSDTTTMSGQVFDPGTNLTPPVNTPYGYPYHYPAPGTIPGVYPGMMPSMMPGAVGMPGILPFQIQLQPDPSTGLFQLIPVPMQSVPAQTRSHHSKSPVASDASSPVVWQPMMPMSSGYTTTPPIRSGITNPDTPVNTNAPPAESPIVNQNSGSTERQNVQSPDTKSKDRREKEPERKSRSSGSSPRRSRHYSSEEDVFPGEGSPDRGHRSRKHSNSSGGKVKRTKSGSSLDMARSQRIQVFEIYDDSCMDLISDTFIADTEEGHLEFLRDIQKLHKASNPDKSQGPRKLACLKTISKSQPNLADPEQPCKTDPEMSHKAGQKNQGQSRHALTSRRKSDAAVYSLDIVPSPAPSPSLSKDSGVSGVHPKPTGDATLMERLLNSDTIRHQQKLSRVLRHVREEFAFDGYMENGIEDLAMGLYLQGSEYITF